VDATEYLADPPRQIGPRPQRAADGLAAEHGALVQVELDALPPDTLRALFTEALAPFWNDAAYQQAVDREDDDRAVLVAG
jgi:hypothetical protein